jgi:hypothetical protein
MWAIVLMDTAPSGTHNLGLLQDRELATQAGLTLFLAGVVLLTGGVLAELLNRVATKTGQPSLEPIHRSVHQVDDRGVGKWVATASLVLGGILLAAVLLFDFGQSSRSDVSSVPAGSSAEGLADNLIEQANAPGEAAGNSTEPSPAYDDDNLMGSAERLEAAASEAEAAGRDEQASNLRNLANRADDVLE